MTEDSKSLSIKKFCELHDFSVSFFYKLKKKGRAPKVMKVGERRIITPEAVQDWRNQMYAE